MWKDAVFGFLHCPTLPTWRAAHQQQQQGEKSGMAEQKGEDAKKQQDAVPAAATAGAAQPADAPAPAAAPLPSASAQSLSKASDGEDEEAFRLFIAVSEIMAQGGQPRKGGQQGDCFEFNIDVDEQGRPVATRATPLPRGSVKFSKPRKAASSSAGRTRGAARGAPSFARLVTAGALAIGLVTADLTGVDE